MKYTDTTQEQRDRITPYLENLFARGHIDGDFVEYEIKAYQQAQKAEIEFLEDFKHHLFGLNGDSPRSHKIRNRLAKLKFESELE